MEQQPLSFAAFCTWPGIGWSGYRTRLAAMGGHQRRVSSVDFSDSFCSPELLRPLVPLMSTSILRDSRMDTYFADSHQFWIAPYRSVAQFVSSGACNRIGMDSSLEDFDYPMFILLGPGIVTARFAITGVRNLTASYVRPESRPPCVVVCLRCANCTLPSGPKYQAVGGRVSVFGDVAVFSPDGDTPNTETMHLPEPSQVGAILGWLDSNRESPRPIDFSALDAKVRRASPRLAPRSAPILERE